MDLLRARQPGGHWVGELATSALSTATAVSALSLVAGQRAGDSDLGLDPPSERAAELRRLALAGIRWLANHQNPDGGWGDTELSHSNVATTFLAVAAFHLAGRATDYEELLLRAECYLDGEGRVAALRRRYGRDKTFAVPILTNCALAGLVEWREVSPLPFELACLPQECYRLLRLPVVSYAIPALVAIGQARFYHRPPSNPLTRWVRRALIPRSLHVLERMQPASGGFLEAVPLTSFVVMSLASQGGALHPVANKGVDFLLDSSRPDGSWPIDTNLATWNTTLALNALAGAGEEPESSTCLDWLLGCQHRQQHPYTGARPGGWGWSDLSGAVPDADDTAGALLALAHCRRGASCSAEIRGRIDESACEGVRWLLELQNADGGWPTFCRGWGKLPFDRSGADLTAHAMRALAAWKEIFPGMEDRIGRATARGLQYLQAAQRSDGSWCPLWFGNQDHPAEENPVYGTARVLQALRELNFSDLPSTRRGLEWLTTNQNPDGGWGGGSRQRATGGSTAITSTVEETALAVEALAGIPRSHPQLAGGIRWLVEAVEQGRHLQPAPIGFYFAKLWYYETLYPVIFTVSALGQAVCHSPQPAAPSRSPILAS